MWPRRVLSALETRSLEWDHEKKHERRLLDAYIRDAYIRARKKRRKRERRSRKK